VEDVQSGARFRSGERTERPPPGSGQPTGSTFAGLYDAAFPVWVTESGAARFGLFAGGPEGCTAEGVGPTLAALAEPVAAITVGGTRRTERRARAGAEQGTIGVGDAEAGTAFVAEAARLAIGQAFLVSCGSVAAAHARQRLVA
jgi:hypothetical protein